MLLATAALPGWAQGDSAANLPRVNVSAPGIGAHTVCPALEADMRKALAQVAMQQREPGLLDVNFAIDGRRIDDVAVVGGPFNYRSATCHIAAAVAIYAVLCQGWRNQAIQWLIAPSPAADCNAAALGVQCFRISFPTEEIPCKANRLDRRC